MPSQLQKKLREFQQNPALRERFEKLIRRLALPCILWPRENIAYYDQKFCLTYRRQKCVFPLEDLADRIYYAGIKLAEIGRCNHRELHPVLAYFYLSYFQAQLSSLEKVPKRAPKAVRARTGPALCRQIEKLKKNLDVPLRMQRARGLGALLAATLYEFQNMSKRLTKTLESNTIFQTDLGTLELELRKKEEQSLKANKLQVHNQRLRFLRKRQFIPCQFYEEPIPRSLFHL